MTLLTGAMTLLEAAVLYVAGVMLRQVGARR